MTYAVRILRTAQKELAAVEPQHRRRLVTAIRKLAKDPRPQGCKKLANRDAWRVRVGAFRVIYEIYNDRLLVLVVAAGHRRDVYR